MPEIAIKPDEIKTRAYKSEKELNNTQFRIKEKLKKYSGNSESNYRTLVNFHAIYSTVREKLSAVTAKDYRESVSNYLSAFSMHVGASIEQKQFEKNSQNNFYYFKNGFFQNNSIDFNELHPLPINKTISSYSSFLDMPKMNLDQLTAEFYRWVYEESLKIKNKKDYKDISNLLLNNPVKINNLIFNGFYQEELPNEIEKTDFDSIGGYSEIKKIFLDLGRRMQNINQYQKYALFEDIIPRGILLYGPPGNGKTTFEKAFCSTFSPKYKIINASEIRTKFVNESANLLANEIEKAREFIESGCRYYVLVIDEIEELARLRGSTNDTETDKMVNVFNNSMDGLKKVNGLLILGSTNHIELMDNAVLSRFDSKIYFGLPDFEARKSIFENILKKKTKNLETKIGDVDYDFLAKQTEKLSCREINDLLKKSISYKADRIILLSESPVITTKDIFLK